MTAILFHFNPWAFSYIATIVYSKYIDSDTTMIIVILVIPAIITNDGLPSHGQISPFDLSRAPHASWSCRKKGW